MFLFIFSCFSAVSQRFLVVQKANTPKQVKYVVGDEIGVKVLGDEFTLYGELMQLTDSTLVIEGQRVFIHNITKIYDRTRIRGFRGAAISTLASVPFFIAVTSLNNWINTGDRPLVDDGTWRLSGAFAGISAILFSIGPKKYPIGNRWMLKSINTSFAP